jgi:hypothetical protein
VRRTKREETERSDLEQTRLNALKREQAEKDAISALILGAKKRNKHLGSIKHAVCEAWVRQERLFLWFVHSFCLLQKETNGQLSSVDEEDECSSSQGVYPRSRVARPRR